MAEQIGENKTIIAGSNSYDFAKRFSDSIDVDCNFMHATVKRFADGEMHVRLQNTTNIVQLNKNNNIIIIQSTSPPVNDNVMELLMLINEVKKFCKEEHVTITTLIPYFGYSRQKSQNGTSITKMIIDILLAIGITNIITLDVHQKCYFNNIHNINVDVTLFFAKIICENIINTHDIVLVAPDIGSESRVKELARYLKVNFVQIYKIRHAPNMCCAYNIIGDVTNKRCVIVDDIIDTGGTLIAATNLLLQNGAISAQAIVTHAILSDNAVNSIMQSDIQQVIITNTIAHEPASLPQKFVVVDITSFTANWYKKFI